MANEILHSVSRMRPVYDDVVAQKDIHSLVNQFVAASVYRPGSRTQKKMINSLMAYVARIQLPGSRRIGSESVRPIIRDVKPNAMFGSLNKTASAFMKRETMANLALLRTELEVAGVEMSSQVQVALSRAIRLPETQSQVIADIVASDKEALKSIGGALDVWGEKTKTVQEIERKLQLKPNSKKLQTEYKAAKKELNKARRSTMSRRDFLARFETKTRGHARDAIRREAYSAQEAEYRNAGFGPKSQRVWVTVNGSGSCPDCESRHGDVRSAQQWIGNAPGDGTTVCLSSCMCQLVPQAYTDENPVPKPLSTARKSTDAVTPDGEPAFVP